MDSDAVKDQKRKIVSNLMRLADLSMPMMMKGGGMIKEQYFTSLSEEQRHAYQFFHGEDFDERDAIEKLNAFVEENKIGKADIVSICVAPGEKGLTLFYIQ